MRKSMLAVMVLLGVMLVSGLACGGGGGSAPTPTPTPTATPDGGITTKMPEDIIPLTVLGFKLLQKYDWDKGFDACEYSAYSLFSPNPNTEFDGKVQDLLVTAFLFENDTSAIEWYMDTAGDGSPSTEIQVNGAAALVTYDNYRGEAAALQSYGRLVILSDTTSPLGATTFDEQSLKDAAIEGLKAIRW
ncbi:MAG: hypothetical protein RI591_05715 [Dehalococcoidia bacterium]|nr:hypothetical protein [Dehalococcoidia bacterium]